MCLTFVCRHSSFHCMIQHAMPSELCFGAPQVTSAALAIACSPRRTTHPGARSAPLAAQPEGKGPSASTAGGRPRAVASKRVVSRHDSRARSGSVRLVRGTLSLVLGRTRCLWVARDRANVACARTTVGGRESSRRDPMHRRFGYVSRPKVDLLCGLSPTPGPTVIRSSALIDPATGQESEVGRLEKFQRDQYRRRLRSRRFRPPAHRQPTRRKVVALFSCLRDIPAATALQFLPQENHNGEMSARDARRALRPRHKSGPDDALRRRRQRWGRKPGAKS